MVEVVDCVLKAREASEIKFAEVEEKRLRVLRHRPCTFWGVVARDYISKTITDTRKKPTTV